MKLITKIEIYLTKLSRVINNNNLQNQTTLKMISIMTLRKINNYHLMINKREKRS